MSDNTNNQRGKTEQTQANLANDAVAAWMPVESTNVVRLRVNMDITAPTPEQQKKLENDAAQPQNQFYVSNWKFRRNPDGTIGHLKTGGDKTVLMRTDDLGDGAVGYSFRRYLGKAATGGECVLEDRMVVHQKSNELGNNGFTALDDSMMFDTSKKQPYTYLREVVANSADQALASKKILQYYEKSDNEHKFLVDKITKLHQILGLKGKANLGYEIQDPALDLQQGDGVSSQAIIEPGNYYTNLAGRSNVRPIKVPIISQNYSGYAQGMPGDVPVSNQQYNGYRNGMPGDVPVSNQQYNGYRNGRPVDVPVGNGFLNNVLNSFAPGRNTHDGSNYNHIGTSGGRNTHDGSSYMHIPNNGGNDSMWRKPSRPVRQQEPRIEEKPPVYVQTPAPVREQAPVPATRKPEQKTVPATNSGKTDSGYTTKTDVNGLLLPFKKPEQK